MLSHHERRELERIQDWFEHDDPRLARELGQAGASAAGGRRSRLLRYAADAFAVVIVLLGVVTLNFGLIFFGAVCLAGAACLHLTRGDDGVPRHRRLE
ncbi:hypothetical protein B1813_18715 [Saccharomonospora piscinae]|uniref:DUF3040 domain-containing protein n=1 Tax=Saccharomonospora piscinae TaxID=687388 RepID=A0A1V8ZY79_SACPI|nr:DUF3040 domain-containing protein [Saccharomonospora piscinae]OQO89879.1 hypothetical protein B1813_18715 [Saccharomonospora piscinae]